MPPNQRNGDAPVLLRTSTPPMNDHNVSLNANATIDANVDSVGVIDNSVSCDKDLLIDVSTVPVPSPSAAVSILADEMNHLSLQVRNDLQYQIHGVVEAVAEEDVENKFDELQTELNAILLKPAYDMAYRASPGYVNSIRLQFLRAQKFRAREAARHMVVHFQEKLELFGPELLGKDVQYYDLNEQDRRALNFGRNVIFPFRDSAGRPIMGVRFPELTPEDIQNNFLHNIMRASWFFVCELVRKDIRAQRLGIVCIAQNIRPTRHPEAYNVIQLMAKRRRGWPVHLAVTHYCGPYSQQIEQELPILQLLLEKDVRRTFRPHLGSESQIQQELKSYGIPLQLLPLVSNAESFLVSRAHQVQERLKQLHIRFDLDGSASSASSSRSRDLAVVSSSSSSSVMMSFSSPLTSDSDNSESDAYSFQSVPMILSSSPPAPTTMVMSPSGSVIPVQAAAPAMVENPNEYCVLFGRGSSRDHPGNLRMHQMVCERLDVYARARKLEKTAMSATIVQEIQQNGGKFLKHQEGSVYWVESTDEEAREKVGKIFRRMIQLRKKKNGV